MAIILNAGARKSPLAIRQAEEILEAVQISNPGVCFKLITMETLGDKDKVTPICDVEGTDFFTRELDQALSGGTIDFAIHSAKDLPDILPDEIELAAVTRSIDPDDVLVSKRGIKLSELPAGSGIGTSSKRRKEQIRAFRPDLKIIDIRGNIQERLNLLGRNGIDAIVIAGAALQRLGLANRITERLSSEFFDPNPLQGRLAVTIRKGDERLRELFLSLDARQDPSDTAEKTGKVFLVGAGPGDPELITVRGWRLLGEADVVLYDDLASEDLLKEVKAGAKLISVGKRAGRHTFAQDEINALMAEYVRKFHIVVRLKGGDPYVFGRGSEEVIYLRKRQIPVEVIPGVSSAVAAAASAGIPLTHRGVASSFSVVAGHGKDGEFEIQVPDGDTLVYLMCVANLEKIVNAVAAKRGARDIPCAVIENGTTKKQKEVIGVLDNIVEKARRLPIRPPAIFVVGNVVALIPQIRKRKVWVTGLSTDRFKTRGEIIHMPVIRVRPVLDFRKLDRVMMQLRRFDWIIFTSKPAVEYFLNRARHFNIDIDQWLKGKVVAIGTATAGMLSQYGIKANLVPKEESTTGIIDALRDQDLKGQRVLIPRSHLSNNTLPRALRIKGSIVTTVTVYRNDPEKLTFPDLNQVDEVIFTSPSTVDNFFRQRPALSGHVEYKAIGSVTAARLGRYGARAEVIRHVS